MTVVTLAEIEIGDDTASKGPIENQLNGGGKRSRRRKAVEYRLLKLYEAAREDGRKPDPGFDLYQHGAKDGFDKAFTTILELVNPTDLASHVRPQYVFGYYDGLVAALHHWLDQLEKDRLVSEPDDD